MKVTFPHMGNTYVAAKALLEDLDVEVVVPPKCSKRTLEIGTRYSPESICLPLKINIGNYIESIENGADTIIITGSCGPCRFGYYSVIQREILKDLGYDVEIIVFDPPDGRPFELIRRIMKATNTTNILKLVNSFMRARKVLIEVEELDNLANSTRAYALEKNKVDIIMNNFHKRVREVHGVNEIRATINNTINELKKVPTDSEKKPLKVGITGEIYTVIEPFVNLEIERKLGHMGVLIDKSLTPVKWVDHHLLMGNFGISEEKAKWKAARPYLRTLVGGHGRETVGSAVLYAQKNFDGVIQLLPFTCMPEIVAESILPTVQKDYKIPILTLIVDELTGEAGYQTRLEAFVDLLHKRREELNIG